MTNTEEINSLRQQANTFLLAGEYQAAEECFTKLINKNPSCWAYAHRGEARCYLHCFPDALADFQKAVNQSDGTPRNYAWAYAHWGYTLHQTLQYQEAREKLNEAVRLDPNYAWAYAHRGATYIIWQGSSELDLALADFNKAIELFKGYAWAYAWRSVIHLHKKQCTEAYMDLLTAMTLDPTIMRHELAGELEKLKKKDVSKAEDTNYVPSVQTDTTES
ncbi:MAG: hypothetical protein DRR19_25095 [Candidatus Parabeggiatoa sp. nov. 1]|nr:MAG: hypothetical protein DRR19_25095 [Gammaproteobacteria bacterium]